MSVRYKAIIIGALVGASVGGIAAWAYMMAQDSRAAGSQRNPGQLQLQAGAGDFVKIGVTLMALLRQVSGLFKPVSESE